MPLKERQNSRTKTAAEPRERQYSVVAVERAADILLQFIQSKSPTLGVTELSSDLGLSKATVHRILTALCHRDIIKMDAESSRYALGSASLMLGMRYLHGLDVRTLALPELQNLSDATQETATLSMRVGDTRVYVEQRTPPREVIMSITPGVPYPLHAGASSRAFLSFLPDAEFDAYVARNGKKLAALTGQTITSIARLKEEVAETRLRGYTISTGERKPGAGAIAAPIFDHHGQPCAVISVCGPAERLASEIPHCAEALLAATGRLSIQMGYSPP
jgi:DNA-binding IclR family transcriptional regulator